MSRGVRGGSPPRGAHRRGDQRADPPIGNGHTAAAVARARHRVTARAMVLAVCVTAVLIAAVFPLRTYLSQRSQSADLERQTAVLEHRIARLEQRIQKLHDPQYLEQLARQCLGMVKPGEVAFVIVPKHGAPKPLSC